MSELKFRCPVCDKTMIFDQLYKHNISKKHIILYRVKKPYYSLNNRLYDIYIIRSMEDSVPGCYTY